MTGGYLERVVESGMTSLRDVRGSIPRAAVDRDREEQQVTTPAGRDETVSEPTRALPVPRPDVRINPRNAALSLPPDITSVQRDALSDAPATQVQPPAPAVFDAASPTRPPRARFEDERSHDTRPATPPDAKGIDVHAPSLKDAGIRSVRGVWSRDEVPAAKGGNRQRPVPLEATVQPLERVAADDGVKHQRATSRPGQSSARDGERPSPHPGVSAERAEQWRRLKDRLLIEHYPATSNSHVPFEGTEHNASQPTNRNSASREIVIDQLEVLVAAPPASPTPAPGPTSVAPRSGAWSVATRRYLGKL